ncbi:MAG: SUMF1/EgtB/PvdO family nonheme iron enzyme [Bacteroidetes bacterium]|nr:SUMF1/EgtB/PvdO family nonheme iron enzyme [Bacteroidota bacterium]
MSIRTTASAALFICCCVSFSANAQSVFVNGGSVFNDATNVELVRGNYTSLQIGARTFLTRSFELQSSVTIVSEPSVDAALRFRPLRSLRLEPYLFAGYGLLFASDDFRSVVPAGLGVQYQLDPQWSVHVEGAGMWTVARDNVGQARTIFGISPNLGVSFKIPKGVFGQRNRSMSQKAAVEPLPASKSTPEASTQAPVREIPKTMTSAPGTRNVRPALIDEDMSTLPDGMFIMGLADEDPLSLQTAGFKRITVSSFKIDRFEVTNADYRSFLSSLSGAASQSMLPDSSIWKDAGFRFSWTAYFRGDRYADHPVVGVNYVQAKAYCAAKGQRLPTEAEWEYAARSGREGGIYPWDGFEARNSLGEYMANYNNGRGGYAADGYAFTAPVNSYAANEWGLYNMSGNVAEWVEDAYSATYLVLSDFNPYHIDEAESRRVVRGGSWASDEFYIGVGVRDAQDMDSGSPYTGFRCAVDEATEELFLSRPDRAVSAEPVGSETNTLPQTGNQ